MQNNSTLETVPPIGPPKNSVVIAAETIGERNGLGNYLACLVPALERQLAGGRDLRVLRNTENARPPVLERYSVTKRLAALARGLVGEGTLRNLLRPSYRRIVRRSYYPEAASWVAKWRSFPRDVVCLLPHVVCIDAGALDDYYESLAEHPVVWVVHDLHPLHFPDQWDRQTVDIFRRRCLSLAASSRWIIAHNEYTKLDVCKRLGVDQNRIVVAHLPSILPECDQSSLPSTAAALADYGIRPPYALWASSNTLAHKNHDRLLRAWRLLLDSGKDLRLVCTGRRNPRWKQISELIHDLGLEEHVVFTDDVPREVLWVILENAKLAVCPTLFEGGGSGPATEAVMRRIPLACSRIPQIQEQFDFRGDLCEWFDPSSDQAIARSVEQILTHYEAALARAELAHRVYPKMRTWEQVATLYWRALDEVSSQTEMAHA